MKGIHTLVAYEAPLIYEAGSCMGFTDSIRMLSVSAIVETS